MQNENIFEVGFVSKILILVIVWSENIWKVITNKSSEDFGFLIRSMLLHGD